MIPKRYIKLFNVKYGTVGDMTYGANGLMYQIIHIDGKLQWILLNHTALESEYLAKAEKIVDEYGMVINDNQKIFLSSTTKKGLAKKNHEVQYDQSKQNITNAYLSIVNKLFPKRHLVKNFGRQQDLDKVFAIYLLFRMLHYYGIRLDRLGLRAKGGPQHDTTSLKFFDTVMKFIGVQTYYQLNHYTDILQKNEADKWKSSMSHITFPKKIRLLEKFMIRNIGDGHKIATSKKYLNELLIIHKLINDIIKFNLVKKSTHLQYYFYLFRFLQIELIDVINFLRHLLPPMNLTREPVRRTIKGLTSLTSVGFGYGLYYLIFNEYIGEQIVWDWNKKLI